MGWVAAAGRRAKARHAAPCPPALAWERWHPPGSWARPVCPTQIRPRCSAQSTGGVGGVSGRVGGRAAARTVRVGAGDAGGSRMMLPSVALPLQTASASRLHAQPFVLVEQKVHDPSAGSGRKGAWGHG